MLSSAILCTLCESRRFQIFRSLSLSLQIGVILNGKQVDTYPTAASKPARGLYRDEKLTDELDPSKSLADQNIHSGDLIYKKPGFGFPEIPEEKILGDK